MMSFFKKDLRSLIWPGIIALLIIVVPVVFYSCYPGEINSTEETDMVVTLFDQKANFSAFQTFAMPDTVVHVGDDQGSGNISRQYDTQILNRIRQNLQQLGYTEEANPAQADVLVVALGANTTWVSGSCYWSWGYWYPYPGYCYPVAYSYTTGTIVMVMADPKMTTQSDALWFASINGLVSESGVGDISSRINKNIDQAFDQSPYLGAGK